MNYRYEISTPPPQRSKSSMYTPHHGHRKLSPAVNNSFSLHGKLGKKKLFLSERHYKHLLPESTPFKSQKAEELMQMGTEEINKQEYEAAISTFSTVMSLDSNNIESIYFRGMCYYKLTKYKSAIPDFTKVINADPLYNKYAYYLVAICFEKINDSLTAIRHISKCLYHFPKFNQGYILRGNLYNLQQRYDKAISDFRKALSIDVNDGSPLLGMAESLEKISDSKTAYKILSQAMTYPEIYCSAIIKRAQLLVNQKKYSQAIEDFNTLLEKYPNHPEGFFYKGKTLIDTKEYSFAVLCFEQSIKHDKENTFTSKSIYYLG